MTTLAVVALAWVLLTGVSGLVSPGRFPTPADTWAAGIQAMMRGYGDATLVVHVLQSLKLVALGFLASIAVGVPLGLLMGWSKTAEAVLNPVFMLLRPIPPLAWIPLAILWLGLGDGAKILVIFFAAFVPSVINTQVGVKTIERPVIEAARMLGTPRWRFVREVLVPGASPMIFTGLRLSLQASWTTLVAAELVGALAGLGHMLNLAQQDLYPGMILVGMVCVAIFGALTTALLGAVERRALAWKRTRGGAA
ncbi:ABC transporter permease [Aquabacter cavernae]|uniref:ABC transporter permease n=1 Tax=Aquabacter cavernae TaxID=2496029 RepID=UPI001FDF6628|nr:ABC transporter permease [Aquabacter cavernae]